MMMMAVLIGPTFSAELQAAGISLNGISWDTGTGVIMSDDPAQVVAAEAVLAKHDPTRTTPTTSGDFLWFMSLFTDQEQAAIIGSSDIKVQIFRLMAAGSPVLSLSDQRVIDGVNYLVGSGLITASAATAVMAGTEADNRAR